MLRFKKLFLVVNIICSMGLIFIRYVRYWNIPTNIPIDSINDVIIIVLIGMPFIFIDWDSDWKPKK